MWLETEEYAGLCSAIRTLYANKIPKKGLMLYREHLYVYTQDELHKIECVEKVIIAGNEDRIDAYFRRYRNELRTKQN